MAYQTGQASSASSLLSIISTFAASNGFTVASNVFSTSYSFTKLTATDSETIAVRGYGNSAATIEAGPEDAYFKVNSADWPITYHLFAHANPAEFFCICNYGADRCAWLSFGELKKPGVDAYTGGGYYSAIYKVTNRVHLFAFDGFRGCDPWDGTRTKASSGCFFWGPSSTQAYSTSVQSYARINTNGHVWSGGVTTTSGSHFAHCTWFAQPLLARSPNTWNSQAVLLPIRVCIDVLSGYYQDIGSVAHARLLRVDNFNLGDIVTLGSERWKVFPFHRKNTVSGDSGGHSGSGLDGAVDHTGTYGWAIRYDGP